MIHINGITIKNFRPYYGIKEFSFGKDDGVSIILGDNGVGKSSLIRAIKFVLFDEFENRDLFSIKNELNIIAWEEQNFEMYVSLDFRYNDSGYILKRIKRIRVNIHGEPQSDSNFESVVTLIKDNQVLSYDDTNLVLKNIVPRKIAEFILFEGETISKYKDLLDNNRNLEIYDSIRKILGVNTLENSLFDLSKFHENLITEKTKLIKESNKNESFRASLDQALVEKENYEKEKFRANKEREEKLIINDEYTKLLKSNSRTSDLMKNRDEINLEIKRVSNDIDSEVSKIKDLLKNYRFICNDLVKDMINNVSEEMTNLLQVDEKNRSMKNDLKSLQRILELKECQYCGGTIGETAIAEINKKISDIQRSIVILSEEDIEKIARFKSDMQILNDLLENQSSTQIYSRIKESNINITKKLIERDNLIQKKKDTSDQIDQIKGDIDIEKVISDLKKLTIEIKKLDEIIFDCEEKLRKIKSKVDELLSKSIEKIDLTNLDNRIKKTEFLKRIFVESIDKYSKQMRIKVQNDATTIFKQISENSDYDKLEFDEKYGLKLIDKHGRSVPNISSGYMTLITISLIYGLHKNSTLTGTIFLDAPFSVLTNFHRDNIIRTFQSLSPQVILLVYKDQIDLHELRNLMQGKLIKEYEIYQDSSENDSIYKTKIKEVQNG